MKSHNWRLLWLCAIISISSCLNSKTKLSFTKLDMAGYLDSSVERGKVITAKGDSYIMEGYKESKETQNSIDSFVEKNKDSLLSKYSQYEITIYKKSAKTNLKNLTDNPRDLVRYSQTNDRIYEYVWTNGVFLVRRKIKNGEIIEPKYDIKVEDIPDTPVKNN